MEIQLYPLANVMFILPEWKAEDSERLLEVTSENLE